MKKVTVLLTTYSDWVSKLVGICSGRGYMHASIGLEDEPNTFYSFNYRGFCVETLEKHRRRGVRQSVGYELSVSDAAYESLHRQVDGFKSHTSDFEYTRLGVVFCLLGIPFRWKRHYFCSQFVAEMLKKSEAFHLRKSAELYMPNAFCKELCGSRQLLNICPNPV